MRNVKRQSSRPAAYRYGADPHGEGGFTLRQLLGFALLGFVILLIMNADRPHCSSFKGVSQWDQATVEAYATCKK